LFSRKMSLETAALCQIIDGLDANSVDKVFEHILTCLPVSKLDYLESLGVDEKNRRLSSVLRTCLPEHLQNIRLFVRSRYDYDDMKFAIYVKHDEYILFPGGTLGADYNEVRDAEERAFNIWIEAANRSPVYRLLAEVLGK